MPTSTSLIFFSQIMFDLQEIIFFQNETVIVVSYTSHIMEKTAFCKTKTETIQVGIEADLLLS